MAAKKMPIRTCMFQCEHFKKHESQSDSDTCAVLNKNIFVEERWNYDEQKSVVPSWCPKPDGFKIITRCSQCSNCCESDTFYCFVLKTNVNPFGIPENCPLEDVN